MVRGARTLKDLFPEPQPPGNKNFIKENVKSLRKMEKLFNTNKNVKGPKFPISRQSKITSKCNLVKIDQNTNTDNGSTPDLKPGVQAIQNGIANLLNKSFHENQNSRKKSAPVISSKKIVLKNPRYPLNRNVKRKNSEQKDEVVSRNKNQQKSFSNENLSFENAINKDSKVKCKSQGVQTLNADDEESIYSDGVIRYPSAKNKESQTPKTLDRGDDAQTSEDSEASVANINSQQSLNECTDNVKITKERTLASKLVSQLNSIPSANHKVGIVPKYIKERKQALKKEQQAKAATVTSDCPLGHIPLPDGERKETLIMLKKNYQDYVKELNMLPIRTDTLRSQKRKMEIEKQLAKLEEAIKVFSRPKVFVKLDS